MTSASAASRPRRLQTAPQSVPADSASREATTAQSTGLKRATSAPTSRRSAVAMSAEDRNCSGRTMNWLIPISASCWRSSSASAFDSDAMITEIRQAAASVTSTPARAAGEARAGEHGDDEHDHASARPSSAPGRRACRPSSRPRRTGEARSRSMTPRFMSSM